MSAQVRVFAPGSVGNVGPGFDILGLAIGGAGDTVSARRIPEAGVSIARTGHPSLPADPAQHASGIAALAVLRRAQARFGLVLEIAKGLPLCGGQGGSAASAVAGALAASLSLEQPLPEPALLAAALAADSAVVG